MVRFLGAAFLIGAFWLLCSGAECPAATNKYYYVDEKGAPQTADRLDLVPEKHRGSAVIVSVEEIDEKAQRASEEERSQAASAVRSAASSSAAVTQLHRPQQASPAAGALPRLIDPLLAGVVALLILVAIVVIGRIDAWQQHVRIVSGVQYALTGVLVLFLAVAYGRDVVRLIGSWSSAIDEAQQRSAERGQKAAQFYKNMENMVDQVDKLRKEQEEQEKAMEGHN